MSQSCPLHRINNNKFQINKIILRQYFCLVFIYVNNINQTIALGITCDLEFTAVSTTVVPQMPAQHEKDLEVTHN